jgi:serine phosphatase RsbU (regulator of sigma subunit)
VDPQRRFLGVASAGHLPLLVRRVTGEVVEFGAASGTPLGVIPCEYREDRVDLRPGDIVLLMTDGIADVLDCPGDRAPSHRLQSIVAAAPHDPAAINEAILDAASRITADQPRDDVTLVALQIDPG